MKSLRLFFLFLLFTTFVFSSVNRLKDIKIVKNELSLEFKDIYNKNQIKEFTLTKPFRYVFDITNTRLSRNRLSKQYAKYIKIAQYKPNVVRVVIYHTKPYSCTPYQPLFQEKKYHIPLPKNEKNLYQKCTKKSKLNIIITERKEKIRKVVPLKEKKIFKYKKRSHHRELIVIDAGHGGHDSGAVGGGKKEKDLVLSVAKRVTKALKKRGYSVYLTRKSNRFLKLSQRTHIADQKGAVAFISIHANSVPKKKRNSVHGIETFFLQNTRDAKSQRIAARENAAVLKGAGSRLSKRVIVDSVLNGPKIVQSNKLAIDVQRRIITNLRSQYKGVRDGGVRHAPFYVLVGASRPSILVEVGYISNPKERKRLFNVHYQSLLAKGIAEGVDNYLNNRRKEIDF